MMKRILAVMVMCCALGAAAEAPKAETPREGAAAILKLLKERNYIDLFQQRYSEWHKVEAEGKAPDEAIKQLSAMWERNYDMAVNLFEQLAKADFEMSKSDAPQKTETGDVATASVSLGEQTLPYRLYKMKNGLWGFHM